MIRYNIIEKYDKTADSPRRKRNVFMQKNCNYNNYKITVCIIKEEESFIWEYLRVFLNFTINATFTKANAHRYIFLVTMT